MDCDEKFDAIQEKLSSARHNDLDDPYEHIMDHIRHEVGRQQWTEYGSLYVPDWIRPIPKKTDISSISADAYVRFIDEGGCRTYAAEIEKYVSNQILPQIPCLIAVDHAMTGGVLQSLSREYGKDNISVIIVDSHTDAITMPSLEEAIQYDIENNPHSVHDENDPLIYNRTNSYNASTFLYHLFNENVIAMQNTYIIGISDYPDKRAFRINDSRIKNYLKNYTFLKDNGLKFITKNDCQKSPTKVKSILNRINTPYVYISIDMDIGSNNALNGVRFRNYTGISGKSLYKLAGHFRKLITTKSQLIGMDITEINPRIAGSYRNEAEDQTYEIAAQLIKYICFGMSHHFH